MFTPCEHCLRKHATRKAVGLEGQKRVALRLCNDCYQKHQRDSAIAGPQLPPVIYKVKAPPSEREMLKHEREIAEQLMASLCPKSLPNLPGYDLGVLYRPSPEVGANHYAFVSHPTRHTDGVGLLVADASGKGVPAAIAMSETSALVRSEGRSSKSPVDLLSKVNRILFQDLKRGMFVTAYYVHLELGSGLLECASAGHMPMVVWRQASGACEFVNPNGLAMAIDGGPLFERVLKQQVVQLEEGDRFTIYTDGIVDALNERQERFGAQRFYEELVRLSENPSGAMLEDVMTSVQKHCGKAQLMDDITVVTVRRLPKT